MILKCSFFFSLVVCFVHCFLSPFLRLCPCACVCVCLLSSCNLFQALLVSWFFWLVCLYLIFGCVPCFVYIIPSALFSQLPFLLVDSFHSFTFTRSLFAWTCPVLGCTGEEGAGGSMHFDGRNGEEPNQRWRFCSAEPWSVAI